MATFTINRSVFEQLPVRRVEAWVHPRASAPGPGEAEAPADHVFETEGDRHSEPSGRPSSADSGGELRWTPAPGAEVRSIHLRTVFDGDRPPCDSPTIQVPEGADPIELSELFDLGARLFDGHALPYQTIPAVAGSFVDVSGQPRSFRLTEGTPLFVVFAGEDYPYGEPIDYDLDYRLTDGNYRNPNLSSSSTLIPVADPLHRKTVTFEGVGFDQEGQAGQAGREGTVRQVQLIQLTVGHLEDGVGWRIENEAGDATLSSARPSRSFTFEVVDPSRALTRYRGVTIFADGHQEGIPETLVPETTVRIGDAPAWWTVEIDPGLVDWRAYALVLVEMRTVETVDPSETLQFFWQGVPSRYWSFQVPLGRSGTFAWRARYVRFDGTSGWTAEQTETSHQAVLPTRLPPDSARAPSNARTPAATRQGAA